VQDLRCKKYTNSGLRSRSPTPLSVVRSQVDSFELGGLCDDDLEESYPAIVETKGPQKHTSHGNEVRLVHNLLRMLTSIPTSL
jgi:hypothetical protein